MNNDIYVFQDNITKNVKEMGLCDIHDYVAGEIEDILEELDLIKYESQIKRLDRLVSILDIAKEKGQNMEYRLQDYRASIEALGFKRIKKGDNNA